jgi:hypothetical protein
VEIRHLDKKQSSVTGLGFLVKELEDGVQDGGREAKAHPRKGERSSLDDTTLMRYTE